MLERTRGWKPSPSQMVGSLVQTAVLWNSELSILAIGSISASAECRGWLKAHTTDAVVVFLSHPGLRPEVYSACPSYRQVFGAEGSRHIKPWLVCWLWAGRRKDGCIGQVGCSGSGWWHMGPRVASVPSTSSWFLHLSYFLLYFTKQVNEVEWTMRLTLFKGLHRRVRMLIQQASFTYSCIACLF